MGLQHSWAWPAPRVQLCGLATHSAPVGTCPPSCLGSAVILSKHWVLPSGSHLPVEGRREKGAGQCQDSSRRLSGTSCLGLPSTRPPRCEQS